MPVTAPAHSPTPDSSFELLPTLKRISLRAAVGMGIVATLALVLRSQVLTGTADVATSFAIYLFLAAVVVILAGASTGVRPGTGAGLVGLGSGKTPDDVAASESFAFRWGIIGGIYLAMSATFLLGATVGLAVAAGTAALFLLILAAPEESRRP